MAAAPSGLRVLIADDSTSSRRLLEATLRKWGYDVVSVGDGEAAWEVLKEEGAPTLAILDWMMPGLSGPEVCRRVREHARKSGSRHYTYLLLLTARGDREDLIEGMESGADDYVTKPFDGHELRVRLGPARRILELHSDLLAAQAALRELALRDPLTQLWNRRAIIEVLESEIARARRESKPLGIALGDLDHFKAINDTHGHHAGDTVLREAAGQLQMGVRGYDTVGRYGGEEFLVVLPGCDLADSAVSADRMRAAIERIPVSLLGIGRNVTISFGVTAVIPGEDAATDLPALVRVADRALYAAKDRGRNRVVTLALNEGVR
jgi:two-component system cell cycle response regulator